MFDKLKPYFTLQGSSASQNEGQPEEDLYLKEDKHTRILAAVTQGILSAVPESDLRMMLFNVNKEVTNESDYYLIESYATLIKQISKFVERD